MKLEYFKSKDRKRFRSKIDETGGCALWLGKLDREGYGTFKVYVDGRPRTFKAHRVAYLLAHGEIDPALTIDHLCRRRACILPEHLEQVTSAENTRRGDTVTTRNANKTHCIRGHALIGANLMVDRRDGHRGCRTCFGITRAKWMRSSKKPHPTHCKHGHELTDQTAYTARSGVKYCRACKRHGGGNIKTMLIQEVSL